MAKLKIGNIRFNSRLFLAPLVEVTDLPYRLICRKSGAGMAYTEMLNIGSILHDNRKAMNMMKTTKDDKPSGIQITGKSVREFEEVLPYVEKFDVVDINCGCPSIRITDNASGSYLLKNPSKLGEMISALKDAGNTTTVKVRLGFKKNNVLKVAKTAEKSGADAITVHARMAYHGKSTPADWKWIEKVKKSVGIPVIGNGDIFLGKHAEEMLDICDGAMIARAAIGNPLVFRNMEHYLKTGKEKTSTPKENLKLFQEYMKLAKKHGVLEIKRVKYVGTEFLKGFNGASKSRVELMEMKTHREVSDLVKRVLKNL